jgi:hypothetical protein
MNCSSYICEVCNPYVFTEELAEAHGYDEDLLPDMLWGIGPKDLHNVSQEDVFAYEWIGVDKVEEQALVVAKGLPFIVHCGDIYKGLKLVGKAA